MIDSICLWNFSKGKKIIEIGYNLSPKFQRKGIMNESLRNVLKFGFGKLNLETIDAFTHKLNGNFKKLLLRNGFELVKDKKDETNLDNIIYEVKSQ